MKISFVIPAYNAEAFLDRCLDSIGSQSFDDYEIVIIDDGSTDGTPEIIKRRAAADRRIRSFARENGGQGAARNFGIGASQGDWIWFVDSDDWILAEALVRIAAILEKQAPDVLVANFEFAFDGRLAQPGSPVPPHLAGKLVTPSEDEGTFATLSCWNAPPWRLISRRELLVKHGIRFAHGVFYEDHPFAISLMLRAEKVFVDAPVSYAYRQRPSSTTHVNDRKALDFITIRRMCLDLFRQHGVYDRFPGVTSGYIAPLNFYEAHVSESFRKAFLEKLDADTTAEEEAFARAHVGPAIGPFLKAVRGRYPMVPTKTVRLGRILRLLTSEGRHRAANRAKSALRSQVRAALVRARKVLTDLQFAPQVDHGGSRFLSAEPGTRVDNFLIDVRVDQQQRPYVKVGSHCLISGQYVFERGVGEIVIGSRSSIGGGCLFVCTQPDGIRIGSNVMLSWNVTVIDTDAHSLDPAIRHDDAYNWKCGIDAGRIGAYKDWSNVSSQPIVIEDNAWIGFGSAILKGVTIGRGAVVGAQSVVTRDVAPYTIVAGNPARFVRLVPRRKWTWEDIVHALQGDPAINDTLKAAYLHPDFKDALRRYRESEEFRDTAALAREFARSPSTMLDVGGGNGVAAVSFALEGFQVTVMEPSGDPLVGTQAIRKMLVEAAEIDPSVSDRVAILQDRMETTALAGRYDFVLCRQVVHHFADPVLALQRIREVLDPTGVVLLVREHVVFDENDRRLFLEGHPMHRYYHGENAYTVDEYHSFARRAGFDVVRTIGFKESPINYHPHHVDVVCGLTENEVAGRPYTFVLKPAGLA